MLQKEDVLSQTSDCRSLGTATALRRLYRFVRPSRRFLAGAILLSILSLGLDLTAPLLLRRLIDRVFAARDLVQLDRIVWLFVLLYFFRFTADLVAGRLKNRFGEDVLLRVRQQLYEHVQGLSLAFFQKTRSGYLTSRILSDANLLGGPLGTLAIGVFSNVLLVAGALAITAYLNWRLTLVLLLVVPLLMILTKKLGSHVRIATRQMQEQISQLGAGVQEAVSGITLIQSYTLEPFAAERVGREMSRLRQANVRVADLALLQRTGAMVMTSLAGLSILWFGGRELMRGAVTLGELMAFLAYAVNVYRPVQELSSSNLSLQSMVAAAIRIFELLDARSGVEERPDALSLPAPIQGRVRFTGVSFAYGEEDVLSDVSFEIEPGMKVAVVGKSGAGKTTLLHHLPRFHDPRTGRVEIDGLDLRDLSLSSLRGAVGIVSQDTFLFSGTIRDNLLCVRPEASEADLLRVLEAAQLNDLLERLPRGLDTEVGERGLRLSGGERQRLSIARVLLKDPPVLILDEATSSIDSISENRIRVALDQLMRSGRTCFVIAHRFTTILDADRILVFDDGRLVGQGTHRDLYRSNSHYTSLYDEQFVRAAAGTAGAGEERRIEEFLVRTESRRSRVVVKSQSGNKQIEVLPMSG